MNGSFIKLLNLTVSYLFHGEARAQISADVVVPGDVHAIRLVNRELALEQRVYVVRVQVTVTRVVEIFLGVV